jgi:hypothetical protein
MATTQGAQIPAVNSPPSGAFLAIYCNDLGEVIGIDPLGKTMHTPTILQGYTLRGPTQSIALTPYVHNPDCVFIFVGGVLTCVTR